MHILFPAPFVYTASDPALLDSSVHKDNGAGCYFFLSGIFARNVLATGREAYRRCIFRRICSAYHIGYNHAVDCGKRRFIHGAGPQCGKRSGREAELLFKAGCVLSLYAYPACGFIYQPAPDGFRKDHSAPDYESLARIY